MSFDVVPSLVFACCFGHDFRHNNAFPNFLSGTLTQIFMSKQNTIVGNWALKESENCFIKIH
ncbi:hypothetical protein BpHYR1_054055 [Brachionus plicatilis]|uniref:Uncharacterized protein n=1 Tax=Brachionus plicatilis TaxID=10195 RepID=A0A3M7RZT8_BRAPC|nr:hypothetical protein BpHYR1_054055 [Brachionus plicatilis]